MATTNGTQAQGEALLAVVVDAARQEWRERLLAAYAMGSLAHGGFCPLVSDIDIGLVIGDPLLAADAEAADRLVSSIKSSGRPFADRLSLFWGSLATLSGAASGGRFPPLDRLDLKKFGRLLSGRDVRGGFPEPTRKELLVVGAEFAQWRLDRDDVAAMLNNPDALATSDPKTLTKLILYPVRFLFTARTGEVGRNEAAVEHFMAAKKSTASELARLALGWRTAAPDHSDAAAIRAIAAGVLPLYDEFLQDHEPRLREYGRPDLADAFGDWRQRLLRAGTPH